jgi:hypothetical protein
MPVASFTYPKGKLVNKHWDQITDMFKLNLFWMCFPKQYITEVLIPETNMGLQRKMNL